jgi:hypothetical protein
MKLVSQSKATITLELSPTELQLIRSALASELSLRRRTWRDLNAKFPEELMYHAIMKDSTEDMMFNVNTYISTYKMWGVLK